MSTNERRKRYVLTGKVEGREMYAGRQPGIITSNPDDAQRWQSWTAAAHAAQALANITTSAWHVVDAETGV